MRNIKGRRLRGTRAVGALVAVALMVAVEVHSSRSARGAEDVSASIGTAPSWYGAESPWNTRIPAGARVDASSQRYVSLLTGTGYDINLNTFDWTPSVYYATRSTPIRTVIVRDAWSTWRIRIPIPDGAAPSPEGAANGDAYMVVIDPSRGCEYDFWKMRQEKGQWRSTNQATFALEGSGVHEPWAVRVASFALGAGLILPRDLERSRIEHALVVALPKEFVDPSVTAPAQRSDGAARPGTGIPVGTLFQLDPALNLDTFKPRLSTPFKKIARALQQYGMYVGDSARGAIALSAQSTVSMSGYTYPWPRYAGLPPGLIPHLRVVQSPVPRPLLERWSGPRCERRVKIG